MRPLLPTYYFLFLITSLGVAAPAPLARLQGEANRMVEFVFESAKEYADPFNEVTVDALFTAPDGTALRVPAFWAGGKSWRARYASPQPGTHRFRSECSDRDDAGLHRIEGELTVRPYSGENPLFRHGALRVAEDKRHFAHADGAPFFWLGDTWWMGLSKRLAWPADFQALANDRRAKGFNVIQIVAGLYPDMPAFDDRGANEAGFPWERDYARIRPEYFDAADRRIIFLAEHGLVPCIVGAWGYHLPWLGTEKMKRHWRNLIARWGALPVVWCAAGETTMPFYLSKNRAAETDEQKREWTKIMRFIRETDPFHRLVTCHPAQTARASVTDAAVLDFDMQQSGHGSPAPQHAALALTGWRSEPVMPVISGEARYEALEINPTLTAAEARQAFWAHLINSGCAGHTYGANGIWQVNRREQPYGKSPGGNNWGTLPWDDAMRLPGSTQLGAARRLIESLPQWNKLEPHPEWVASVVDEKEPLRLASAHWIWFPEGAPAKDAPVARRYFRRVFDAPAHPASARLAVSGDDRSLVWLNGERVGEQRDWMHPREFRDLARHLHAGKNVLAIEAENLDPAAHPNPAGLIARLEATFTDGTRIDLATDGSWQSATAENAGWMSQDFDASGWRAAQPIAVHGSPPWGNLQLQKPAAPLCAAVGDQLRIIYLLAPCAVNIRALAPETKYRAAWFDPVNGERLPDSELTPDAAGNATVKAPPGEHDWVLVCTRTRDL